MTNRNADSGTGRGASTGRAVRIAAFGGPEVLRVEQIAIPQPVDDEVLVRVHAASVNPVDGKTRAGEFPPVGAADLPATLGRDLAGTIEAVGTRAHNMLSHGDRVFAFIDFDRGAQADYVVVKAVELCAIPDGVDMTSAAAIPLAALTAWQGLFDHGGLEAGQRVLIHGGAGGVGQFAIQFARWKGAEVIATAGAADQELIRRLGANVAIDYQGQRFEDIAHDVDCVFDLVDGDTRARSWAVIRPGGILVSTLSEPDAETARAHGVRAVPQWLAQPNTVQLGTIGDLVASGEVIVTVAATYRLEDVAAAQERLEQGHLAGKVVLTLV
ncbi:NADPH:quinone reductase-like Zn-dependent oxidoreductase [Sphingomonas insulae]|uniref:NADP-dependent oxidoreductase n=1 Tax=Sphingomonas insulae TaxID=424800 RepID=UPI0013D80B0E|nr:NADP-dependent oxidoreductase [Sphingomonas insulae]NIJ29981.1 NADPH:quinone reductase-like Zn-dependent oxidoreductase [Sphingomonas insulae]